MADRLCMPGLRRHPSVAHHLRAVALSGMRHADLGDRRDAVPSHPPAPAVWFRAIWHVTSQKYGANVLGLQRVLGLSPNTSVR